MQSIQTPTSVTLTKQLGQATSELQHIAGITSLPISHSSLEQNSQRDVISFLAAARLVSHMALHGAEVGAESSRMLTPHKGHTGETHKTAALEVEIDIENSLQKKIEEVKPGEKGGGEENMEDVALVRVASGAGETVDLDTGALLGVAPGAGEAVEEDAGALVEGVPQSGAGVEAERQKIVALLEGVLESVEEDAGALVRVVPGAGEAVEECHVRSCVMNSPWQLVQIRCLEL